MTEAEEKEAIATWGDVHPQGPPAPELPPEELERAAALIAWTRADCGIPPLDPPQLHEAARILLAMTKAAGGVLPPCP